MKLSPREVDRYFAKPNADLAGTLIYGPDPMRVALKRQQLIAASLGPSADEEMRLTRLSGAELRKQPSLLLDAIKATGFFDGPRAAFVEEASDAVAPIVTTALEEWQPGDAQIIVTSGALKASSKLRKLFEAHPNAYAAAIYDDPPSRSEIERLLRDAGVQSASPAAMSSLTALAAELGPGDLAQTIEKIAFYKLSDPTELTPEDIETSAPRSTEAGIDDILNIVAEERSGEIGPMLIRLQAQGVNAVGLCIGTMRHFRMLYAAASDPGGVAAGVGRLRPPVYGKRRDRVTRQAQNWGAFRLEEALTLLTDTDLKLRSAGQTAPAMALMERALIRLAMMPRSGAPANQRGR